jgi:transposase
MEALLERCAGLDVHQASVVCCVLIGAPGRKSQKLLRRFGTTTRALEGHFELIVGNAHHIKNVPGRKTDVKDAEWIAQLVRHGLVAKSFVPLPAVRDLRELVRYRRTLIETRTAMRNRVLKLLESANIKLSGVASDVFGVSGMAMLEALAAGTASPAEMAGLSRGRMRRKHAALEAALEGRMREHQRFLLAMQLRQLAAVERDLQALDARIAAQLEPFQAQHRQLRQIPGVDWVTATAILAEIGTDMGVFATARRLAAWAGVAPGNYESAGKPKGAATRRGNVFLKSALFAAASAAVRTKGSYYRDKYNRLRARRGPVRALMAIAHKLLIAAFHVLATGEVFRDLGEGYLDQLTRKRSTTRLVQRLPNLGYEVTLVPKAASLPTPISGPISVAVSDLHSDAPRLALSGRDHGLGDAQGAVLAGVEHHGGGVLPRSFGGSTSTVRATGDLQNRQ